MQLLCDNNTPFGVPVDPDVYMMMAVSSLPGETSPENDRK